MLSSYSAGLVAGSLLCVVVLRRFNARTVAAGALTMLALSTLVFAWVQDYQLALSFRLMQGVAGGATWTASITWLLRLYPIEQRGEALGLAVSPAFVGTIAGPLIGTMALDLGIRGPYTAVAMMLAINFCYISVGTLLTRGGQDAGWSLSFATALSATMWSLGETAGALFGGVGLDAVGSMWRQASARRWSPRGSSSWS